MDFENKILSKEISQFIWEKDKTLGTAESCTGGRIAEVSGKDAEERYRYTGFVSSEPEVAKALDPGGTGALYPCKKTAKGLKATKGVI